MLEQVTRCRESLQSWPRIRWVIAIVTSSVTFLIIGIPTAVIPNPFFGRAVDVTAWSVPVLLLTSVLSGLLLATYIRSTPRLDDQRSAKIGGAGAAISYFAVGCPVCNKLALVALGYSGAIKYFAPIQPILGAISLVLLFYVFRKRVLSEGKCSLPLNR